jgi:hypothetical protein
MTYQVSCGSEVAAIVCGEISCSDIRWGIDYPDRYIRGFHQTLTENSGEIALSM